MSKKTDELLDRIAELERAARLLQEDKESLSEDLDEANREVERLEEELGAKADEQAVHTFLDVVERRSTFKFSVPQSDAADRAILALYDAIGRRP
jgi:predicted  nucleic acid-binding Zn-ribbon protein